MAQSNARDGLIIALTEDRGGLLVWLPEPGQCRGCGRMALILVNRNGKTACVHCDAAKEGPCSPQP